MDSPELGFFQNWQLAFVALSLRSILANIMNIKRCVTVPQDRRFNSSYNHPSLITLATLLTVMKALRSLEWIQILNLRWSRICFCTKKIPLTKKTHFILSKNFSFFRRRVLWRKIYWTLIGANYWARSKQEGIFDTFLQNRGFLLRKVFVTLSSNGLAFFELWASLWFFLPWVKLF